MECIIRGCNRRARSYGRLCETHHMRKNRLGSEHQHPVNRRDLNRYVAAVRDWISFHENPEQDRDTLRKLWDTIAIEARAVVSEMEARGCGHLPTYDAARIVIKIDQGHEDKIEVAYHVTALIALSLDGQFNLINDKSAKATLANVVLKFLPTQRSWSPAKGISAKKKDAKREVRLVLGGWLLDAYCRVAVMLIKTRNERQHQKDQLLVSFARTSDLGPQHDKIITNPKEPE